MKALEKNTNQMQIILESLPADLLGNYDLELNIP
jgi:hypothetical protein